MNLMTEPQPSAAAFRAARDLLLRHRDDYAAARREFSWPALDEFNWALDWFDVIAAEHPGQTALRIVADGDAAARLSYGELAARSNQVANWLSELGARRGDRLLLMLGNIAPLWEVILAAMKLGVVIIPASTSAASPSSGRRTSRTSRAEFLALSRKSRRRAAFAVGSTRAVETAAGGQAVTSRLVKRAHAIAQKITAYTANDSSPCSRSEVAIGVRSRESKNSHQWVGR